MIRHDSSYKNLWDLFIIILVLWNCVTIPLQISLADLEFLNSDWFHGFETFVDISFAIDILVNFCSTYVSPDTGQLIVDRWMIAKNYLCGPRFIVDVLASIPFDVIFD